MNRLLFPALLLALLRPGSSLTCYKCNGCETSSATKETCRIVAPERQTSACLVQKIHMPGAADAITIKKCAIYDKDGKYQCQDLPNNETTLSCDVCYADLCNGAATNKYHAYVSVFLLLFLPKLLF